jgi:hypothetical protein
VKGGFDMNNLEFSLILVAILFLVLAVIVGLSSKDKLDITNAEFASEEKVIKGFNR